MKKVSVAIGLIVQEGKILVAKRRSDQHLGGLWEFPGGKMETGEFAEMALDRELQEEVGLKVIEAQFITHIVHEYEDRTVTLWPFLVTKVEGEATALEGNELKWWPLDQLSELTMPAANQPILEQLQRLFG